jgi:hypothetical protein
MQSDIVPIICHRSQFTGSGVDTGGDLPPMLLIPMPYLRPVSTTPAVPVTDLLPVLSKPVLSKPVSLTPVANFRPVSLIPVVHLDLRISP